MGYAYEQFIRCMMTHVVSRFRPGTIENSFNNIKHSILGESVHDLATELTDTLEDRKEEVSALKTHLLHSFEYKFEYRIFIEYIFRELD